MKNPSHVIRKPLLTEKGSYLSSEHNHHAFLVDRRASKDEIKAAVEEIYGVKVVGVSTQVRKGRRRRTRFGYILESETKKATVRLAPGSTIELL